MDHLDRVSAGVRSAGVSAEVSTAVRSAGVSVEVSTAVKYTIVVYLQVYPGIPVFFFGFVRLLGHFFPSPPQVRRYLYEYRFQIPFCCMARMVIPLPGAGVAGGGSEGAMSRIMLKHRELFSLELLKILV
jgi:hypothetical protein